MRRGLEETPDEGYAAGCEALAALDLRESIGAIRAPTLVILGAWDPAAPPDHGQRIVDVIPEARLLIVPAAHLANLEAPEWVTDALVDHFTAEVRA
jgi:3-oxoadipate enol-lactonase